MIPEKVIYRRDLRFCKFSRRIVSHKETTRVGKRTHLLISCGLIMVIELSGVQFGRARKSDELAARV